jgi:hypothetical protein
VLRQEVPPASPPARHNLPAPLTSFLGREQDLARLDGLLGEVRLVTLTGTGGTGKTRLAVEAGARVAGRFPDGVWLAELAGVADPGLVAAHVMGALGVRQAGDVPVLEALIWRLRSAGLLLVLDNCEHLLGACAELAATLLRAAPGLRVLATSREPLGIPGEVVCTVRPLDLPPEQADAHAVGQASAVRLFLDRGSAARGGTAGGVAPVAVAVAERICRKLDGLPLATRSPSSGNQRRPLAPGLLLTSFPPCRRAPPRRSSRPARSPRSRPAPDVGWCGTATRCGTSDNRGQSRRDGQNDHGLSGVGIDVRGRHRTGV